MNLEVKKVNRKNKNVKKLKKIFNNSFPKDERMPFWLMRLMSKMGSSELLSFYDGDLLCGFIYMAVIDNITFIIYLAVDTKIRSKGYGSAILNEIQSMYEDNKIVVYIDIADETKEDNEQILKRKKFYLNNGYEETNYLVNSTKDVIQEILIKNGEFDKEEFIEFYNKYTNKTMKPKLIEK